MESGGPFAQYKGKNIQRNWPNNLVLRHPLSFADLMRLARKELKDIRMLPRVIAIDEYKGDTKEGKYQLIIADGETKEPIDILPNRRKKTIANYLRKYGENVEIVIMDMSPVV